MSCFNQLLDFCNKYEYIYCYGAGYIGEITKNFLDKYGVQIKGYIETKKRKDVVEGIKVFSLEEVASLINSKVGIILSLDEKYHLDVIGNLNRYNINNVFFLTNKDIKENVKIDLAEGIIHLNNNQFLDKTIDKFFQIEMKKKSKFESLYLDKYFSYKKIIVAQYYMRHIGEMCLTFYLWNLENRNNNDTLYVMFPILLEQNFEKIPNNYFLKIIMEKMEIITEQNYEFWKWMMQYHNKQIEISNYYDFEKIVERDMNYPTVKKPLFSVDLDEDDYQILKLMNLKKEYVCIYSRDNAYYKHYKLNQDNDIYNFTVKARNSSIRAFDLTVNNFIDHDIDFVRMGYKVEEDTGENIIDYANKYRTEKLDFYLLSKCKFFMVSGSGIMAIAILFGIPLVCINFSVLSFGGDAVLPMSPERDLIIMKKLWHSKQKRYLSLDEILYMESKVLSYELFVEYNKLGIIFEDNSPEELFDIANEMNMRINGEIMYTEEEEELQRKYRKILESHVGYNKMHFFNGRFGTDFLKKNPWFLEIVPEELSIKSSYK